MLGCFLTFLSRKANGIILVYDITTHSSFRSLERWREEATSHAEKDAVVTLVGNKVDMKHLRTVERSEAKKYAELQDMNFIEASAKDSTNVELAFENIIEQIYQSKLKAEESEPAIIEEQKIITPKDSKQNKTKPQQKCC